MAPEGDLSFGPPAQSHEGFRRACVGVKRLRRKKHRFPRFPLATLGGGQIYCGMQRLREVAETATLRGQRKG